MFSRFLRASVLILGCTRVGPHASFNSTPYYAISDVHGDVSIPDVPAGRYQLQIFHAGVAPDALRAMSREITITPGQTTLGTFALAESDVTVGHKNKYGRDYDRPDPDAPAYARP